MRTFVCAAALLWTAAATAQESGNFRQQAFGKEPLNANPLLSAEFPRVSMLFANKPTEVSERSGRSRATFRSQAAEAVLTAVLERDGPFTLCRIRPAPGPVIPAEELKLTWAFPMDYNESMTLDAGTLAGFPLYLPDGSLPPVQQFNWGTLFYNRRADLAIGSSLQGIEPGKTRWRGRSGPKGPTQFHFWATMGRPEMEVTLFA